MDVICGCDLCLVVWVGLFGWVYMVLHGVCVFISIACFDVCLGLLGGLLVWMVWCFGGFGGLGFICVGLVPFGYCYYGGLAV